MINVKLNNKGVSLPLVVGLVLLLMVASVSINELIIRALRNAQQIEASDRAYFSAEAGVEDALYELSEHFSGYETGDINVSSGKRINDFGGELDWKSDWEIKSMDPNGIFGSDDGLYLYPKQKLIIPLYVDNSGTDKNDNVINEASADISTITAGNFYITFKIPWDTIGGYSSAYNNGLTIDNDGDLGNSNSDGDELINGLNEDAPGDLDPSVICSGMSFATEDRDCDGKEDEDSNQDPVILWKMTNNAGDTLVPVRGCLTGIDGDEHDPKGTEICEKDFEMDAGYLSVSLSRVTEGVTKDGYPMSISEFLNANPNTRVQIEFLIVAPLKQAYEFGGIPKTLSIPYIEYNALIHNNMPVPLPYFTINSDGWYKNFKQSITTIVTPKTAVPLFDFTIIQQQ